MKGSQIIGNDGTATNTRKIRLRDYNVPRTFISTKHRDTPIDGHDHKIPPGLIQVIQANSFFELFSWRILEILIQLCDTVWIQGFRPKAKQ